MPIVAVVTQASEALPLVKWATACALARERNVIVMHPAQRGEKADGPGGVELPLLGDLPEDEVDRAIVEAIHATIRDQLSPQGTAPDHLAPDERLAVGCPVISALRVTDRAPAAAVLEQVAEDAANLVLVTQHEKNTPQLEVFSLAHQLLRRCPCDVIVMRPGASAGQAPKRILVPTAGGPHATEALKLARQIAHHSNAKVDALFVEPRVGADAEDVGAAILDRLVRKALGPTAEAVGRRVVLANDFRRGIAQVAEEGYDLVLVGASNHLVARKVLFSAVPASAMQKAEAAGTSVAVLRRAIPVTAKLGGAVRRFVERTVPQLDREARVTLVERVQGSSRWDFDFVSLICLSTMIATLGLITNSVAVVIGAMLVAPLMTPLVGCGLALVQGNVVLIRHAIRAVVLGFLLAFTIGALCGLLIPGAELNTQMLARTRPNVLDLGVAFVSGLAAAYATARPNLSAALPGVAIAAALVPPISTCGLALALGRPVLSAGAALLFLTNIVAIVLGSAIVLFTVGIRAGHTHGRNKVWVRRGNVAVAIAAAVLAVPLSYLLYAQISKMPRQLIATVQQRVEAEPDTRYLSIEPYTSTQGEGMRVVISAPAAASAELADELSTLFTDYFGRPTTVRVVTQLVTESVGEVANE